MSKQSHIERTAHEPRDSSLHTLTISSITQITPTLRVFQLQIPQDESITFLPGQWVDLYPPPQANVPKPGGFTITSSPTLALPPTSQRNPTTTSLSSFFSPGPGPGPGPTQPYIELAIQCSPHNPPAAYLFLPAAQLLHTPVQVRIGGSFVFPPPPPSHPASHTITPGTLRKLVFVAGGMGINPLMSMLSFIGEPQLEETWWWRDCEVRVLYSVRDPRGNGGGALGGAGAAARDGDHGILFLDRIVELFETGRVRGGLELFLTGGGLSATSDGAEETDGVVRCSSGTDVPFSRRRMTVRDVERTVGGDKESALVYVCGIPAMTDEFVDALTSPGGMEMDKSRVLFEKWW
ncbi:hypothetical protein N658DRAFT_521358 [Parathielavia hyrcaniae]|uniref:FAD-binding FR-type domain-containing protein n=1 Tax=Parathielavia hyrcaniae TaxID=113614 RepID=A0AAN6Q758_9PEZI|nr:hypothetical protein N658DRAFT_521358 [Parathielavia hyrcaniae]